MDIKKLIERQLFVNEKCGFELNPDGLYLGYFAEVGELSSVIALYKGIKKPKPKDLEKYGGWRETQGNRYWHEELFIKSASNTDFSVFSFQEAWNHNITRGALLREICDEFADVLVYVLQLKILHTKCIISQHDLSLATREIKDGLLDVNDRSFNFISTKIDCLEGLANAYDIDLEEAYYKKTNRIIERFN